MQLKELSITGEIKMREIHVLQNDKKRSYQYNKGVACFQ